MTDRHIQSLKEFESSVEDLYRSFPYTFRCAPNVAVALGWHGILADFASEIEPLIERYAVENPGETLPYLDYIKEKYGMLTLHMNNLNTDFDMEPVEKIVSKYERQSLSLCEVCGRPGSLSKKGWITVSCSIHR